MLTVWTNRSDFITSSVWMNPNSSCVVMAERDRVYCNDCESRSESDSEKPLWLQDGKPYKCDRCQATFCYNGNLASHKSVHTGTFAMLWNSAMVLTQTCVLQFYIFILVYYSRRETVPLQRVCSAVQQTCQSEDTLTDPLRRKTIQMWNLRLTLRPGTIRPPVCFCTVTMQSKCSSSSTFVVSGGSSEGSRTDPHWRETVPMWHLRHALPPPSDTEESLTNTYGRETLSCEHHLHICDPEAQNQS